MKQTRRSADHGRRRQAAPSVWRVPIVLAALALIAGGVFWWDQLRRQSPTREGAPSWSPNSKEIVYYAEQPNGKADLFLMDREGVPIAQLTDTPGVDEGAPAFSPDGQHIAFDSDLFGNFEIMVMSPAANAPARRLTTHPGRDLAPAWTPDSRHILFMSDRDSKPEFDIYRMNADGTQVERLTKGATHWFPQVARDGLRVAMHVWRDVHILNLKTKELTRLTTDPLNGMYPSWSPDTQQIAFMSWRNGPTQIFTMNSDGTNPTMLVAMPRGSAIDPRWSPDGSRIAFVHVPEEAAHGDQSADQQRLIYTVELESGRLRRLSR